MAAGLRAWLGSDLRRRARSVTALTLLFGFVLAVPAVALSGARRADTAFARAEQATLSPHASIERGGPHGMTEAALAEARSLPEISVSTTVDLLLMRPVGTDLFLAFDFLVYSPRDAALGDEIGRAHIVAGRERHMDAVDEVIVDEVAASAFDLEVGSKLELEAWTNAARDQAFIDVAKVPQPDGPVVETTVVGIYRDPQSLAADDVPPAIITTPAFHSSYVGRDPDHGRIGSWPGIMFVRLVEDATFEDLEVSLAEVERRHGAASGEGFALESTFGAGAGGSDEQRAQVLALQIFAAAASLAGLFVVGQAFVRHVHLTAADLDVLRSLGATPRDRAIVVGAAALPMAVGGAGLAIPLAWWVSSALPFGTPGLVEPTPGRSLDLGVVGAVLLAGALLLLLWGFTTGWRMTWERHDGFVRRSSTVRRWIARAAPRPAPSLGLRMALDRGSGRVAVPVGPALVGAVVGLAGVAGSLVFNASLHHLLQTPALYGWDADAYVRLDADRGGFEDLAATLDDDDRVLRLSGEADVVLEAASGAPARFLDGTGHIADSGPPLHTLIAGRFPTGANEIALGPRLADEWGVGLGDAVEFVGADGGRISLVVVGLEVQPQTSFDEYNNRFTMPIETAARIASAPETEPVFGLLLDIAEGYEAPTIAELEESGLFVIARDDRRSPVASLGEVDVFPLVLAGFLALLAVGFLAHALAVATRQSGRDLAVLKALGLSRRQLASVVAWHATAVAAVGVLAGMPLGVVVGRASFDLLVDSVDVRSEIVTPGWLVVAALGAIVVANLLAIRPALRAARTPAAAGLRAE